MSEEKNFKDKIQLIPIEKLKLDDKNAKQHTNIQIDQLKKSIERFGFLSALVINKDFVVVAGNGRLQALRLLPNYKEVPCYQVDFISEAEQRFLSLMDNAIQMQTGFLAEELQFNMEIIEKDTLIFQELQRLDFSSLDRSNLEILPTEGINQKKGENQNNIQGSKEIDIDNIDTSECKIIFKFDALMYESILNKFNKIKEENNFKTNELVLLELLENYGT
jgi:ParB-like chromosome segregation protein Spo0J